MATDKRQCPVMTTTARVPVTGSQNSLTAAARGSGSVADNPSGSR